MLRVISDVAAGSIGFEPYSPRALEWVEAVVVALGGEWRTVDGRSCYWLPVDRVTPTMLADSGLEIMQGPVPPGMTVHRHRRHH